MAPSVGAQVQGGVGVVDGTQSGAHRGPTASPDRCHFDLLSDELLLEVFSYASATELAALSSTARRFRQPTVLLPSELVPPAVADVTAPLAPYAQLCSLVEAAAWQHLQHVQRRREGTSTRNHACIDGRQRQSRAGES